MFFFHLLNNDIQNFFFSLEVSPAAKTFILRSIAFPVVWLRHRRGGFSSFFYFLSCGLFSPFQFRHLSHIFCPAVLFDDFKYNFLVFLVEARERKVF